MSGKKLTVEEKARRKYARMDQTDARNEFLKVAHRAICQPFDDELKEIGNQHHLAEEFLWDKLSKLEEAVGCGEYPNTDAGDRAQEKAQDLVDRAEPIYQKKADKLFKQYEIDCDRVLQAKRRALNEFDDLHRQDVYEPLHIAHLRPWRQYVWEQEKSAWQKRPEQSVDSNENPPEKPNVIKPQHATKQPSGWLSVIASLFH